MMAARRDKRLTERPPSDVGNSFCPDWKCLVWKTEERGLRKSRALDCADNGPQTTAMAFRRNEYGIVNTRKEFSML